MNRKRTQNQSPTMTSSAVQWPPSTKRHCTGTSLSTTKNEPAHYMLKIESFSILSENPSIIIESDVFEASELHPNGNKEEDGANHLSLYLIICDGKSRVNGWNVLVDVKFFVYDHIARNYVTFQDADGNRTRFHEKKLKWGFDKLVSLDQFKDSSKGYLFNDSFVFGAEVFVVPDYTLKDRCFSITKPPTTANTHTWTIDNFSPLTNACLNSEVFKMGKVKNLSLFPKGTGPGARTHLSCFLRVNEAHLFPNGWRIYGKFQLRVKNQSGYDDKVEETDQWFCNSAIEGGFHCFMPLIELSDVTKGFLLNNMLIIELWAFRKTLSESMCLINLWVNITFLFRELVIRDLYLVHV
ncbi:hypothetical protein LXL04_017320 [Taraxacum kok-saghyz]